MCKLLNFARFVYKLKDLIDKKESQSIIYLTKIFSLTINTIKMNTICQIQSTNKNLNPNSQEIVTPEVLYSKVVEVKCRVVPGSLEKCQLDKSGWKEAKGSTGETVFVTQELDEEYLMKELLEIKKSGIDSLAIVLMHSFT